MASKDFFLLVGVAADGKTSSEIKISGTKHGTSFDPAMVGFSSRTMLSTQGNIRQNCQLEDVTIQCIMFCHFTVLINFLFLTCYVLLQEQYKIHPSWGFSFFVLFLLLDVTCTYSGY